MPERHSKPTIWSQLATFVVVGGFGAILNAGIYAALVVLGIHYAIASVVAWMAALAVGYILNRKFAFKSDVSVARSLPRVLLIYIFQQAIAIAGIAALTELGGVGPIYAYIMMMPPAILFSFVAMRTFAFK